MAFKGADARRLETANDYLGNELVAALELGGMDYQQMDMEWMGNLLGDQRASAALLPLYLTEYSRAVKKHLDAAGEPITAWLDNRAQSSRTDPRA